MTPLLLLALLASTHHHAGKTCGTERWAVKTLTDKQATEVKTTSPHTTTIAEINGLEAHCDAAFEHEHEADRVPLELEVFEVVGRLTRDPIHEADGDFHLPMEDPDNPGETMIWEIPDPACATGSPLIAILKDVRARAVKAHLKAGMLIRARGVYFYDLDHRQTGRSKSCVEGHPLVDFEVLKGK